MPDLNPPIELDKAKSPWKSAYEKWRNNPTPEAMESVLKALNPTISYAIASVNGLGSPTIKAKARALAARAVKTYDPNSGAGLPTWTNRQLLGLRRIARHDYGSVKVPEKAQLDAMAIERARRELHDRFNREPTAEEIADISGISVKRQNAVAKIYRKIPSENEFGEAGMGALSLSNTDFSDEAIEYVAGELDPIDKKILEYKTGRGGMPILEGKEIAKKLKIHPSQISRRSARIAMMIDEMERDLIKLHSR